MLQEGRIGRGNKGSNKNAEQFHDALALPRCRVQGKQDRNPESEIKVSGTSAPTSLYQGAGKRVRDLLDPEPEEEGYVFRRKPHADLAVDHRFRISGHGEGCEDPEIGGLEEVDLHLHVVCLVQPNGVIR
jgi:hypothetical protein